MPIEKFEINFNKENAARWYGLKEDGKIIHVRHFDHYPRIRDFDVITRGGRKYVIVVVRIREVSQTP